MALEREGFDHARNGEIADADDGNDDPGLPVQLFRDGLALDDEGIDAQGKHADRQRQPGQCHGIHALQAELHDDDADAPQDADAQGLQDGDESFVQDDLAKKKEAFWKRPVRELYP